MGKGGKAESFCMAGKSNFVQNANSIEILEIFQHAKIEFSNDAGNIDY